MSNILNGALTVKVVSCHDLRKTRLIGKMDPYVKLDIGSDEKVKTKVATDMDRNPVFDQSFLFNCSGNTDLHVKVYDNQLIDTYIGRIDLPIVRLLLHGGGDQCFDIYDPDNFKLITGRIRLNVSFNGSGAPSSVSEQAPISGLCHFQHNSSGLIVHVADGKLVLGVGGINDMQQSFEWQGPFIRYAPTSQYIAVDANNNVIVATGISETAKWKWSGVGLQHVSTGNYVQPVGNSLIAGAVLCVSSGASASSGFSLQRSMAAELAVQARIEAEIKERAEAQKLIAQQIESQKVAEEAARAAETERQRKAEEEARQKQLEQEQVQREQLELERERERLEQLRIDTERQERERLEREKAERQKLLEEAQRLQMNMASAGAGFGKKFGR